MNDVKRKAYIKLELRSINGGVFAPIGELIITSPLGSRDVYRLSDAAIKRATRYARKNKTSELPAEEAEVILDDDCRLTATFY